MAVTNDPAADRAARQWARFNEYYYRDLECGVAVDISRMDFPSRFLAWMEQPMREALAFMEFLERGGVANPDECRRVGHYWLRTPGKAPESDPEIQESIEATLAAVIEFAAHVRAGTIAPERGGRFKHLLLIGVGGSALGPQFLADALGDHRAPLQPHFLDNTDGDGFDRVFALLGAELAQTLTIVISKSGRTKETRNGMLEARAAYEREGLTFGPHAVAITEKDKDSELFETAEKESWRGVFPMWDWVGGRTSICSAVGLLPLALLGCDLDGFLAGARRMDELTRNEGVAENPAALLALMWYYAGKGEGAKDMVVLPYKDRLALFPRYLQQLVMESLGKEYDLEGRRVNQGIVVYGNKGSTDQHAYVQQLRGGANNFFVTFIEVLRDRSGQSVEVQPGVTSDDFLHAFLQGTRKALWENGRESITITLERLDAAALGALIALFDRAVGFYARLININAYNQPGVEDGKVAAEEVVSIQAGIIKALAAARTPVTAEEVAGAAGLPDKAEIVYRLLRHLAANPGRGVGMMTGARPREERFVWNPAPPSP
jgi:glucose-6-phosphate isomerase